MVVTRQSFPCALPAPAEARHFVGATLARWGQHGLIPEASVVVTELSTNAVVHAKSDFVVSLATTPPDGVRVAVSDHSPAMPAPRSPGTKGLGGRGLLLVAAMSKAWGARPEPGGKTVWAELVDDG